MKKLTIFGSALIAALLAACSDDSSSSSNFKEPVVSCNVSVAADGDETPLLCWQAEREFKDLVKEDCDALNSKNYITVLSDEECDISTARKDCRDIEDSLYRIEVYGRTWSGFDCELINLLLNDEIVSDEGEDGGEEEPVSVVAAYNIPEQRCVQYNWGANPKSELEPLLGKHDKELDATGFGLINVASCDEVAKLPVVTCTDNDTFDSVRVVFYDEKLKGKKCEKLVTFIPVEETEEE